MIKEIKITFNEKEYELIFGKKYIKFHVEIIDDNPDPKYQRFFVESHIWDELVVNFHPDDLPSILLQNALERFKEESEKIRLSKND